MGYAGARVESTWRNPPGGGDRASRAATIAVVALVIAGSFAPVFAAGTADARPSGFVGVPDANVNADLPAGADVGVSVSDLRGSTMATDHASTLEVKLTTADRAADYLDNSSAVVGADSDGLALVLSDDVNHEGREVALPLSTVKQALGHVPDLVHGVHDDGTKWTRPVREESGLLVFEVPHFSDNAVTFESRVSVAAIPATDGSQISWDVDDLDAASDVTVNMTGRVSTESETKTVTGLSNGDTASLDVAGDLDPTGPSGNNEPAITFKAGDVPGEVHDIVDDNGDGDASDFERAFVGDDGSNNLRQTSLEWTASSDGTIDTVTVNIASETGSYYGADVDVYIDASTGDTLSMTEGTKVATWTPSGTTGVESFNISDYSVTAGTTYEIQFVTQSSDSDATADALVLAVDQSPSTDKFFSKRGGLTESFANYGDVRFSGTTKEVTDPSVDVDGDGSADASYTGTLSGSETATVELAELGVNNDMAEFSASSGVGVIEVKFTERTATTDPGVVLNGNEVRYNRTLSVARSPLSSATHRYRLGSDAADSIGTADGTNNGGEFVLTGTGPAVVISRSERDNIQFGTDAFGLDGRDSFTACAQVRPDGSLAGTERRTIIAQSDYSFGLNMGGAGDSYEMYIDTQSSDGLVAFAADSDHAVGTWRTVCARYGDSDDDGSTEMSIIEDGETLETKALSGVVKSSPNSDYIGAQSAESRNFGGAIREVRIWHAALSDTRMNDYASHPSVYQNVSREKASLTVDKAALREGTNTLDILAGDGTLSSDAPEPKVSLVAEHDAVSNQTVEYQGDAWSERYNVSKTWADSRQSATLTIPFATNVLSIREVQFRTDSSAWTGTSNYELDGTTVTVNLGSVDAGETTHVRVNGSRVRTHNGSITVTSPTVAGNTLDSEFRIDSRREDFYIGVGGTESGGFVHHLVSESWTSPSESVVVESDGTQRLYAPNAPEGATANARTIPVEVQPENDARVSVVEPTEPSFKIEPAGTTGDSVDVVYHDTVSGNTYGLVSVSRDGYVIDKATAESPVTLTDPEDDTEVLAVRELSTSGSSGGGGAGGGGGGGAVPVSTGPSGPLSSPIVVGPLGVALVLGAFLIARRTPVPIWVAGGASILAAVVVIESLAPGSVSGVVTRFGVEVASGVGQVSSALVLAGGAIALWGVYRLIKRFTRRDQVNLNVQRGN